MGSGSEAHEDRAAPLGGALAGLDVHLLTGGGGGVMASVCRAYAAVPRRSGRSIGILPSGSDARTSRDGYPNAWVDIPIRTHLPFSGTRGTEVRSRNHINVLSADVIVALPGSAGTSSEVRLAVEYGRPVIAFVRARSEIPELPESVPASDDLEEIMDFVRTYCR